MTIIRTVKELMAYRDSLSGSVGFVPTMGALHSGHLSLIQKSISENENTIVSIFVNPTQFLEGEDFEKYPKRVESDIDICKRAGANAVFLPDYEEMYSKSEPDIKAPKDKAFILEGFYRPEHFDGVLRVVLKLLNLTHPTNAYFGKKDAQQVYIVQNMVKSLFLRTNIIPCEIVRQNDGLALSSRNIYLSDEEQIEAQKIPLSLKKASEIVMQGNLNSSDIKQAMLEVLSPLKVDYVEIVNREFEKLEKVELKNSIVLVAAHVGKTRLIDNMWI